MSNTQNAQEIGARARKLGIPLVGDSEEFLRLLESVERISRHGNVAVLIRGETGTGKELIARATHYLGPRAKFPFVPVNCGALPDSLFENELFGHRSGAFTGADAASIGLVRLSDHGTLFLDEVDALPPKAQVALLRFLQDGHFRPLGSSREERSDVRVIAACNSRLEDGVTAGRFRQDLFFRLNLLSIDVPPLRSRDGDVSVLSEHFLDECARVYSMPRKFLHQETVRWFNEYGWPGNVRELQNLLHRECLMGDELKIRIAQPPGISGASALPAALPTLDARNVSYRAAKTHAVEAFDRAYLTQLLLQTGGNITKAAQIAGKERRSLGRLLKRYHISLCEQKHDHHR